MSRRAALYLRSEGGGDPLATVLRWLERGRFVAWQRPLPSGYATYPDEVRELVYRPAPVPAGFWSELVPEAAPDLFRYGLELASAPFGLAALAVTDTWDGKTRAKLYRGGRVLLKLGEDRDDELAYFVPPSEPRHFDEAAAALGLPPGGQTALQSWGRAVAGGQPPRLDELAAAFALPDPPATFRDRKDTATSDASAGLRYLLYVSKDSPLYLNA